MGTFTTEAIAYCRDQRIGRLLIVGNDLVLREITRIAVGEVVPAALAKTIEIEYDGDSPVEVLGDARLLRILLRNLLDNAVRYSPAQPNPW